MSEPTRTIVKLKENQFSWLVFSSAQADSFLKDMNNHHDEYGNRNIFPIHGKVLINK